MGEVVPAIGAGVLLGLAPAVVGRIAVGEPASRLA
jgi:hypothetical protein